MPLLPLVFSFALAQADLKDVTAQRDLPRLRAAISLGGGPVFVIVPANLFQSASSLGWFGLSGELGVMLDDRLSVSGRVTLLTNLGAFDLGGTAGVDFAVSDHVSLGGGVGVHGLAGGFTSFGAIMIPLRVGFAPWGRKPTDSRRNGLMLGLELAGGMSVALRTGLGGPYSPSASALLTVGYAWW